MVEGLTPIQELASSCEIFILSNKHREIFPRATSYRAKTPLELVHTNLCV
jgi:hypothetical protein